LPQAIVDKVSADIRQVLSEPESPKFFQTRGNEAERGTLGSGLTRRPGDRCVAETEESCRVQRQD